MRGGALAPAIKEEVADPNVKLATLFGYMEERFKSKSWSVRAAPRRARATACPNVSCAHVVMWAGDAQGHDGRTRADA
jgi:hypothetical protein